MEREFHTFLEEAKTKVKEELAKLEGELKKLLPADAHSQLAEKVAAAGQAVDTHLSSNSDAPQAAKAPHDPVAPSGDAATAEESSADLPSPQSA